MTRIPLVPVLPLLLLVLLAAAACGGDDDDGPNPLDTPPPEGWPAGLPLAPRMRLLSDETANFMRSVLFESPEGQELLAEQFEDALDESSWDELTKYNLPAGAGDGWVISNHEGEEAVVEARDTDGVITLSYIFRIE